MTSDIEKLTETDRMRNASGNVQDSRMLVAFLYALARDEVPIGKLEGLIDDLRRASRRIDAVTYTNGWLAQWAKDAADRLTAPKQQPEIPSVQVHPATWWARLHSEGPGPTGSVGTLYRSKKEADSIPWPGRVVKVEGDTTV